MTKPLEVSYEEPLTCCEPMHKLYRDKGIEYSVMHQQWHITLSQKNFPNHEKSAQTGEDWEHRV